MGRPNVYVNYLLAVQRSWLNRSVGMNFFHLVWGVWLLSIGYFIQAEFVKPGRKKKINIMLATTARKGKFILKCNNVKQMFSCFFHYLHSVFPAGKLSEQCVVDLKWMRLCLLWLLPRVIHDSTSCPQDRWINNERKESRRMLPRRLCTTDETLPTPTFSIGLRTSHSARTDSSADEVNWFYKSIIIGMIQQLFISKKGSYKISELSWRLQPSVACLQKWTVVVFAWEKHRLITGCSHTPKCWSMCWWSWSSRLHTPLAGPQIPQVNTPAAESCGCLGCPARGDLPKHEQTPDNEEASPWCYCHNSVARRWRKGGLLD